MWLWLGAWRVKGQQRQSLRPQFARAKRVRVRCRRIYGPRSPSLQVTPLLPVQPGAPSPLAPQPRDWDLLLTAETHNFPCAVAPYPGAETGAGGRMRDTHATGTGSMMGAGTAGYCVGNLRLDGATLPHEDMKAVYPGGLGQIGSWAGGQIGKEGSVSRLGGAPRFCRTRT